MKLLTQRTKVTLPKVMRPSKAISPARKKLFWAFVVKWGGKTYHFNFMYHLFLVHCSTFKVSDRKQWRQGITAQNVTPHCATLCRIARGQLGLSNRKQCNWTDCVELGHSVIWYSTWRHNHVNEHFSKASTATQCQWNVSSISFFSKNACVW